MRQWVNLGQAATYLFWRTIRFRLSWFKNTWRSRCFTKDTSSISECSLASLRIWSCTYSSMLDWPRESYVRLSSYEYTLDKLNYYIHLTNNAVQSSCDGYGKVLKGNIFPISELESYAAGLGKKTDLFMNQIKNTIKTVFDATNTILNPFGRKYTFELYGFDFMADENFKVWMLECNSGPSLSESNFQLSCLLHRMLGRFHWFKMTCTELQ